MARFLALDWGQQQVALIAGSVARGLIQIDQTLLWQADQPLDADSAEQLGRALRDRLKSAGIAPAPVLACIARKNVILKEILHPPLSAEEEATLIRLQVIEELTEPVEQVVIDYTTAPQVDAENEQRALALVAGRRLLQAYQALCRSAGLKLLALTPRFFVTLACLQRLRSTPAFSQLAPDAVVALLTQSEGDFELTVARGDVVLYTRALAAPASVARDVQRNLAMYAAQPLHPPAQALFLASNGESEALREELESVLGVPVSTFDPCTGSGREAPPGSNGALAGPMGLLALQADKRRWPINFVRPREPRPPRQSRKRTWAMAAGVACAAVIALISFCYAQLSAQEDELDALAVQRTELERQLAQKEEEAKRNTALDEWLGAEVVWIEELRGLSEQFPDTKTIELTQWSGNRLNQNAKGKYVARLSFKGVTFDDFQPVDHVIERMLEKGRFRVEPKGLSRNTGADRARFPQQFTITADIAGASSPKTSMTGRDSHSAKSGPAETVATSKPSGNEGGQP
ncbi:MAG TPA: hypothetical protein VK395_08480 [Gemmataceae bacterium]|nr:hypothetical protein [Gemmataceae bacterium]